MDEPSATFAGYRLEQLLVVDTVSATYRAISEVRSRQRRPVALRISRPLDTGAGPDHDAIAAFLAKIDAAAAVNHPGLATIHDAGERDSRVYVATELVVPDTLDEYIRRHGPLPASEATPLLMAIAEGLDYAHAAGIVHGAISPRTIWLHRRSGDARMPPAILTGFGLDALLARQVRADRNRIDVADVGYVAPEQLRGSPATHDAAGGPVPPDTTRAAGGIDGRADQYALACALYHCVSGRPPFVRDTVAAMFGAHLFSEARVPAGRGGDRALGPAVAIGMSKLPDARHPSCVALVRATGYASDSGRAMPAMAGAATPPQRPRQPPHRQQLPRRRQRARRRRPRRLPISWPAAAMLVLAGIVCTLILAAVLHDGDQVDTGAVRAGGETPAGHLESPEDGGSPSAVGMAWQRALAGEPVRTLHVVGRAVVAATDHRLFALDPRGGATRWERADAWAPIRSVTASDGTIYGIQHDGIAATLVALDAATGDQRWQFDGGLAGTDANAVVGAGSGHVVVLQDGHLLALDPPPTAATARRTSARWHVRVNRPWLRSLAVLPDAVIVATRDGRVCAYAPADGARQWCVPIVGSRERAPAIVANRNVIAVVMPFHVTALSRETGAVRWIHDAHTKMARAALSRGRDIVVTDVDGTLHGLDGERGHERWRASGLGKVTALGATADAIYAGTRDGRVVSLQLDGAQQAQS